MFINGWTDDWRRRHAFATISASLVYRLAFHVYGSPSVCPYTSSTIDKAILQTHGDFTQVPPLSPPRLHFYMIIYQRDLYIVYRTPSHFAHIPCYLANSRSAQLKAPCVRTMRAVAA